MGKRSEFVRREKDYYPTIDKRAIIALLPYIGHLKTYSEPCYGKGHLVTLLSCFTDLTCVHQGDIETGQDALHLAGHSADAIITNPPWSRNLLHPLITHLKELSPVYFLLDADWAHTKQSTPFMKYCSDIYPIGRLKWIEGSKDDGKDNCCWYRFQSEETATRFHSRLEAAGQPTQ